MTSTDARSRRTALPRTLLATAAALVAVGTWAVAGPAAPAGAAPGIGGPADPSCQATDDGERVAVVVAFSATDVHRRCVAAGGSGIDVLRRAGFAPVTQPYQGVGGTAAVCAVTHPRSGEQMGCAAGPSCLTCADPDYWSYYRGSTRGYAYQGVGGGSTTPQPGLVEAWQWGRSASWQHERVGPSAVCAPPETTTTTTTTAPRGGTPAPGGAGGPRGGSPGGGSAGGGSAGGEQPRGGPSTTAAGDDRPGEVRPPTTAAPEEPADPDDPAASDDVDVDDSAEGASPARGAGPGDDEEAAGAPPAGTVTAHDEGEGRSALVPVAATGSLVAALAALALRARRRRSVADPPPA